MTINERIQYIVDQRFSGNKASFAKAIGIAPTSISNYLSKSRASKPTSDILGDIINVVHDLSASWLLTGKGDPFPSTVDEKEKIIDSEEEYKEAIEKGLHLLPEINFKFSAGQTHLVNTTEDITRYWYLPDCKDCEGVAQVIGRSMSPTLPSGCWVALKKYTLPRENPNTIPFGNIFGVVVEDEFTGEYHGHIKVLRRYKDHSLSSKYWIAHSVNDAEFDDFDIKIEQVRSLWIVKQHIVSDIL